MSHDDQYVMLLGQDPDVTWFACRHPEREPDTFTKFHLEYDGKICALCHSRANELASRGVKYGRELALQTGPRRQRR